MSEALEPGAVIGILGGGQLGRMLAIAAAQLGYRCIAYSPDKDPVAGEVCAARATSTTDTSRSPCVSRRSTVASINQEDGGRKCMTVNDFIIVDGEKCAADELDRLRGSSAEWVLIERDGGSWRYVFGRQELLTLPHLLALVDQRADLTAMTLTQALGLREGMASVPVVHSSDVRELALDPTRPSAARFVEMERGHPVAVGR